MAGTKLAAIALGVAFAALGVASPANFEGTGLSSSSSAAPQKPEVTNPHEPVTTALVPVRRIMRAESELSEPKNNDDVSKGLLGYGSFLVRESFFLFLYSVRKFPIVSLTIYVCVRRKQLRKGRSNR